MDSQDHKAIAQIIQEERQRVYTMGGVSVCHSATFVQAMADYIASVSFLGCPGCELCEAGVPGEFDREEFIRLCYRESCPTCQSSGFQASVLVPYRCTFCDGTEGGNPPEVQKE